MNDDLMAAIAVAQGAAYSQGVVWGKKTERDRIIKLLKAECQCDEDYLCHACEYINLIKGNKPWSVNPNEKTETSIKGKNK